MVRRTYLGLGNAAAAVRAFEDLAPWAERLLRLQAAHRPMGPEDMAFGIALDGLESCAYHFTRRRSFYDALRAKVREQAAAGAAGAEPLADRAQAVAAFEALRPYAAKLRALQGLCQPFGRDYMALQIARQTLDSCAYHFTRLEAFYGVKGDAAGPCRQTA